MAQVAHPFGEAFEPRLGLACPGNLGFDLVKKRYEFAAQILPLAGIRLAIVVRLELGTCAGHRLIPST